MVAFADIGKEPDKAAYVRETLAFLSEKMMGIFEENGKYGPTHRQCQRSDGTR